MASFDTSLDLKVRALTPEEFPETWKELRAGVAEGVAPGFVAGLWDARAPDEIRLAAIGNRRNPVPSEPSVSALPMEIGTVFDLASVTKVYATASLAASLVDRAWIRWDTRVRAILPSFGDSTIELRHLLSHTAGFVAWEPWWQRIRERFGPGPIEGASIADRQAAMRELILAARPEVKPGTRALYSDVSFLLLGFVLEEVLRMPLDRAVREMLWRPLGVAESYYVRTTRNALLLRDETVAATEDCPWRGLVQGSVHDDNCWTMGGYGGHAGAFGTARDLLHFSRRLMGGFFSRQTLRSMWSRVDEPAGCDRTLGWDTPSGESPAASHSFSMSSVGHLGFTGTSLWIDPEAGVAVTLLSNRVHPSRENILIRGFRPRFHRAIRVDFGR